VVEDARRKRKRKKSAYFKRKRKSDFEMKSGKLK
jgi:hypothetical protein